MPDIVEHPRDAAGFSKCAAGACQHRADLSDGAIAIVGQGANDDCDAARRVALVRDLVEVVRVAGARCAFDRPVDVVFGHVLGAGLLDCDAQDGSSLPGQDRLSAQPR